MLAGWRAGTLLLCAAAPTLACCQQIFQAPLPLPDAISPPKASVMCQCFTPQPCHDAAASQSLWAMYVRQSAAAIWYPMAASNSITRCTTTSTLLLRLPSTPSTASL